MFLWSIAFSFIDANAQTFSTRGSDDLLSVYSGVLNQPFGYQIIGVRIDTNGGYHFNTIIRNFNFDGEVINTKNYYFPNKIYDPARDNNSRLNDNTTVTVVMDIEDDNDTIFTTVIWFTNEGDTLQTKRFASPYFIEGNIQTNLNLPTAITCSPDGQYIYFVSQIFHSSSQNNFMIKKLTAQGEEVWTYVNPLGDGAGCNAINYNDGQIWFVHVSSSSRIIGINDTTGMLMTTELINSSMLDAIRCNDLLLEDGNVIIASIDISEPGNLIPIIYKCTATGSEIFQNSPQGAEYDYSQNNDHLVKSPDGGYVSCSVKYDEIPNPNDPNDPAMNNTSEKIWLWKVNSEGEFQWQRFYEYLSFDSGYFYLENIAHDLKATPDGGYIMAGEATANCLEWPCLAGGPFSQQGWLLKVDGCGCLVPGCDEGCTVGISEYPEEANYDADTKFMMVGPNPTGNMLNIYLNKFKIEQQRRLLIHVQDLQGKFIQSFDLKNDDTTYMIDTSSLPNGEYVLSLLYKADSPGGRLLQTEKIVVAK